MKVIAINGSPRKNGNTAELLKNALKGAEANGADTKLINLYDLNFRGCTGCFACKRTGNKCDGLCAMRDGLTRALRDILSCNALIIGSPIYFGDVTGEIRSFLERLLFPNLSYQKGERSTFQGKIATGFIYTMNVPEENMKQSNYDDIFKHNQYLLELFHSDSEVLFSCDTYQFSDYSKYDASRFDEPHKAEVKKKQFPLDLQNAYELGVKLSQTS